MSARPSIGDHRINQRTVARSYIVIKKRPDMVPAKALARLNQQNRQFGAPLRQSERNQAPGEATANDDYVAGGKIAHTRNSSRKQRRAIAHD